MKNIEKYLLIFITMLLIGSTLSGCVTITQEDYLRAAERYMEKKYGEKFDGQYFYGMDNDRMYVTPVNHPEWKVSVSFPKAKLWNVEFQDNYVAFLLKEELEVEIKKIATEVYGECVVYCPPMGWALPGEWNRDTTLEMYNSENISKIYLFISKNVSSRGKDIENFLEKYCTSNINIEILELAYISGKKLHLLEENQIDDIYGDRQYFWKAFVVLEKDPELRIDISWREGDLQSED